jgi:heptosyltransferase-2
MSPQPWKDSQAQGPSIAARVPNWLGDAVLATPAVRALVGSSGPAGALVLASTSSREVYARLAGTLTVSVARPGGTPLQSIAAALRGSAVLRKHKPATVVSFTRSLTSAATCFLGGVRRRVGFEASAGAFLYTDTVAWPKSRNVHLTDTFCKLVESIGCDVESRVPAIEPLAEDLERGEDLAGRHGLSPGGFVCMFPGARYGPSKRWGSARFALLGDAVVAKLGLDVVLLGGREDRLVCDEVRSRMTRRGIDLAGRCDFSTLVGSLALARAVVANDSGGMHLAGALGLPVVGLFFSTDPDWTGPRSPKSAALYHKVECSPCFRRDCQDTARCAESIGVDEAFEALTGVLGRTG